MRCPGGGPVPGGGSPGARTACQPPSEVSGAPFVPGGGDHGGGAGAAVHGDNGLLITRPRSRHRPVSYGLWLFLWAHETFATRSPHRGGEHQPRDPPEVPVALGHDARLSPTPREQEPAPAFGWTPG